MRVNFIAFFIFVVFACSVLFMPINFYANNMGMTEARAVENLQIFLKKNDIVPKRSTCAGDSDNDGYGSCSVTLQDDSKLRLKCPTDFVQVKIFGATVCKEEYVSLDMHFNKNN